MPLPNFPQMSLISNKNLAFLGNFCNSAGLNFRPVQADLKLLSGDTESGSGSTLRRDALPTLADRPTMAVLVGMGMQGCPEPYSSVVGNCSVYLCSVCL